VAANDFWGLDIATRLRSAVSDVFSVENVMVGKEPGQGIHLRGQLHVDPTQAYDAVSKRLRDLGYTALFRKDSNADVIVAMPGLLAPSGSRLWLALLMFGLTVLSTLYVGSEMDLSGQFSILAGIEFTAALLGILLTHELSHFTVAKLVGAPVSFPFFIPMPLGPFGTLGAVIQMKAPPKNRRDLLAIAAAGPIGGLIVAIPVLIVGLLLSPVMRVPTGVLTMQEGNSLLYAAIKFLVFKQFLPSGGVDVWLHPIAFAGWAGLLVTGLNLIPAAQLDGGHVAYTLLGVRWAKYLTWGIAAAMVGLGFLWQGWWLWAVLVFFFGQIRVMPLDDITRLDAPRIAIALIIALAFALTFTPLPLSIVGPLP
jgi:Zn-dependent protease